MKNKISLFAAIFALLPAAMFAQGGIERALREIEHNSTALRLLEKTREAAIAENHTGLTLADPEMGFNYLVGSEADMPDRQDYSLSQSLDFATITGARRRVARSLDTVAVRSFAVERAALLLAAKKSCIELVHRNALAALFRERTNVLREALALTQDRYDRGEATAMDLNDARLALAETAAAEAENEGERGALRDELRKMNGGVALSLEDTLYSPAPLPLDFAQWLDKAVVSWPQIAAAEAEIEAGRKAELLTRRENLPGLSIGVMQETVPGDTYRGVTFGLSIPLWSNRGKRRKARADLAEAEARRMDAEVQLREGLRSLYERALRLEKTATRLAESVEQSKNVDLLRTSVAEGRMSRVDFLLSLGRYYDLSERLLQLRRDAELAKAELTAADL